VQHRKPAALYRRGAAKQLVSTSLGFARRLVSISALQLSRAKALPDLLKAADQREAAC
jgi:hypothetical protein